MRPSQKFITALRLSPRNQYAIAWEAGIHPNTLSKLVNGIDRIRENDERIVAVGKILGIDPVECFENDAAQSVVVR